MCFFTTENLQNFNPFLLFPSDFRSSHQHLAFWNTAGFHLQGVSYFQCLLSVSSARLLTSILFLLGMNRGAQCSFEINNSVFFRGGGESLAPLWGDKTLPGVPLGTSHHTSAQKRWKQKGGAVFPFLTADWKAYLPSSLISHSLTAPNASAVAVVSQVATRDCNREMEGEEPDSYSSREKRRLLSASCSKADQKTRLTFQRNFQFL